MTTLQNGSIITNANELELERLSNKILLIKHALGGLLPGLTDTEITHTTNVLEIGCGPGSWSLDMAQTYYSRMQITGIDTSLLMISHANAQAIERRLDNVCLLQVRDLAGPFTFADGSFDLISAQFLSKVLFKDTWASLISECWRLLRPGGWLRFTDFEVPQSNSPAHEELWSFFMRAMHQAGRSFSPDDRYLGLLHEMEKMLLSAGFETKCLNHMIDYSSGTPLHEEWKRDFLILSKGVEPMLIKMGIVSQEYVAMLHLRQQVEMGLWSFQGILPMLTTWAKKVKPDPQRPRIAV